MLEINVLALVLNSLYLLVFIKYTENFSEEVLKPLTIGAVFLGVMFIYTLFEDPDLLEWRFALITATLMLITLALPILNVVRLKSVVLIIKSYFKI